MGASVSLRLSSSTQNGIEPVDGVSDVIIFTPSQLRPVPSFSALIGSDHLLAIGALENRTLMLLNIEKLMTSAEMGLVAEIIH